MTNEKYEFEISSDSVDRTHEIGRRIGELATAGDVILLVGNLGLGKTCLTQGIAWGLGINEYTASPTFVLLREYYGRIPLYHLDLYRLDSLAEMTDLGLDDYFDADGICVVEWANKGFEALPGEHMLIEMKYIDTTSRRLVFFPRGPRYVEMLNQLTKD